MADNYTVNDATHLLKCSHAVGGRYSYYKMKCLLLDSKSKLQKILVFGDRNWKNTQHIKKIRYVSPNRLTKL